MQDNNQKNSVTTDEIMNFLVDHMVTKEELRYEVAEIRKEMATKSELGKLRSDMIDHMNKNTLQLETTFGTMMRAEDRKVGALINLLADKNVISSQEAGMILKLEPFPSM
ncbi:hypothetical protein HY623_00395 [Candidatus Uhrbacteria bacterium]|nr:hypothetical protein [Candidatus Uhrbacteria bacterium]